MAHSTYLVLSGGHLKFLDLDPTMHGSGCGAINLPWERSEVSWLVYAAWGLLVPGFLGASQRKREPWTACVMVSRLKEKKRILFCSATLISVFHTYIYILYVSVVYIIVNT